MKTRYLSIALIIALIASTAYAVLDRSDIGKLGSGVSGKIYSTVATGAAGLAETLAPGVPFSIKEIRLHLNTAATRRHLPPLTTMAPLPMFMIFSCCRRRCQV